MNAQRYRQMLEIISFYGQMTFLDQGDSLTPAGWQHEVIREFYMYWPYWILRIYGSARKSNKKSVGWSQTKSETMESFLVSVFREEWEVVPQSVIFSMPQRERQVLVGWTHVLLEMQMQTTQVWSCKLYVHLCKWIKWCFYFGFLLLWHSISNGLFLFLLFTHTKFFMFPNFRIS